MMDTGHPASITSETIAARTLILPDVVVSLFFSLPSSVPSTPPLSGLSARERRRAGLSTCAARRLSYVLPIETECRGDGDIERPV